jgi:hypothetical protein
MNEHNEQTFDDSLGELDVELDRLVIDNLEEAPPGVKEDAREIVEHYLAHLK